MTSCLNDDVLPEALPAGQELRSAIIKGLKKRWSYKEQLINHSHESLPHSASFFIAERTSSEGSASTHSLCSASILLLVRYGADKPERPLLAATWCTSHGTHA